MSIEQAHLFYIFILTGTLIGILFDIFRILRKSFKTSDFITILQDILFCILSAILLFYTIFKFNNGEIRSYVILGISAGIFLYLFIFSKLFIKVNVKIIDILKNIFKFVIKAIALPLKIVLNILRKLLVKPISFIFINVRKNIYTLFHKMSKIKINPNKFNKKKKKMQI